MNKVLVVMTNIGKYGNSDEATGLWLGEATEFVAPLIANGYEIDYVSPLGGYVPIDPRSMKYVNHEIMTIYEQRDFQRRALGNSMRPDQVNPLEYRAIYFTGGHGVMWDFPDNQALQDVALAIYNNGGFVTSVCHGIAGLLGIKQADGNYLIKGKKITGFTTAEEWLAGKQGQVPYFSADVVQERGGIFVKQRAYCSHAIQDERLITGQNPFSVDKVAQLLLKSLK